MLPLLRYISSWSFLVTSFLFGYFGFRLESILASILFVQIYVLIIQAEAMLRQAAWSEAAYDAVFQVSAHVAGQDQETLITVANSGERPAYNFFIGLKDETVNNRLEYRLLHEQNTDTLDLVSPEGHTLSARRQRSYLASIPEEEFRKRKIILRIAHDNVLGHSREMQVISFENSGEFLMIPSPVEPGFLVRAYQDLMLLIRWHFTYRKLLKK